MISVWWLLLMIPASFVVGWLVAAHQFSAAFLDERDKKYRIGRYANKS